MTMLYSTCLDSCTIAAPDLAPVSVIPHSLLLPGRNVSWMSFWHLRVALACVHPGGEGLADVVYIPIYDQLASGAGGVQGVLEVMVHCNAQDPMVVANAITFVGTLLSQLQVSALYTSYLMSILMVRLRHNCFAF